MAGAPIGSIRSPVLTYFGGLGILPFGQKIFRVGSKKALASGCMPPYLNHIESGNGPADNMESDTMPKITFTLPESIALAAQGHEFTVDASTFHPDALEGIFTYGVRRWFQDSINSQAHTFRKAKDAGEVSGDFDTPAAFAARLESAVTGILSTPRGSTSAPAFSQMDETLYAIAVEVKAKLKPLSDAWTASKGMVTAERKTAMLAAVRALPAATFAKLESAARVRLEALAGLDL